MNKDNMVVVGRVSKPHGIRGELRVKPFTQSPDIFCGFRQITFRRIDTPDRRVNVVEARPHKAMVLLKVKGVIDRNAAEELIGADILVQKELLPVLEEGEYYWNDLVGLAVYHQDGRFLGAVESLFSAGADDIVVIKGEKGEIMIPFRSEMVLELDQPAGRMVVNPPEGLIDSELAVDSNRP